MTDKEPRIWDENEYGLWCTSCGYHVSTDGYDDLDESAIPQECRQCGYPDDIEKMTEYHT